MAPVTCPKCKKTVNTSAKTCPNCGGALSYSVFDKNAPQYVKLHLLSNVFMGLGCVLLIIEFMNNAIKTYAGGVLFGVGFLFQGLALSAREKEAGFDGKKRGKLITWISVAIIIIGILYFYLDLR